MHIAMNDRWGRALRILAVLCLTLWVLGCSWNEFGAYQAYNKRNLKQFDHNQASSEQAIRLWQQGVVRQGAIDSAAAERILQHRKQYTQLLIRTQEAVEEFNQHSEASRNKWRQYLVR